MENIGYALQDISTETDSFIDISKSQVQYTLEELLDIYQQENKPIEVDFRKLISNIAFTDRATHRAHPYPAKLLPHIPVFFLSSNLLSKKGDIVLDPFCGSGTVLLEAILNNRKAIGADSNPLARLISTVKTSNYSEKTLISNIRKINDRLKDGKISKKYPDVVNIDYWFHPHVKEELANIQQCINETTRNPYKDFFKLCLSATVKKVSLADPNISVPVRLNHKKHSKNSKLYSSTKNKLIELLNISAYSQFNKIVEDNIKRVRNFNKLSRDKKSVELYCDARNLSKNGNKVRSNSVQLIITSPPYAGAQKYIRASSLNLGWTDLCGTKDLRNLEKLNIGREHYSSSEYKSYQSTGIKEADSFLEEIFKINPLRAHIASNYLLEMKVALDECYRVLNKNGYMVLVSSNNQICGKVFETHKYLVSIAERSGFSIQLELIDHIHSRGLMTKRNKTAGIISSEWVYLLKKEV